MHISRMPQIYNYISKDHGLDCVNDFSKNNQIFQIQFNLGELNICFKGNTYVYNICVQ